MEHKRTHTRHPITKFGLMLKVSLLNQGETLRDFAKRVGVAQPAISMMIRKHNKKYAPRIETVMKVIEGFDSKAMRDDALRAYMEDIKPSK